MKASRQSHKLLIFLYSMSFGGAERVTANLANHWAAKGWQITIVTLAPQSMDSFDLHPTVNRISLELSGDSKNPLDGLWQNIRRIYSLNRVLREIKPNFALSMMDSANILLGLSAKGLPFLFTVGAEHNHPPQQPLGYLWETLRRYVYGSLHAVTALTNEGKDWIKTYTNAKKVTVIPNAVTWPLPIEVPQIDPAKYLKPSKQILLAVGRLTPQKGFDRLIEVFSKLASNQSNWDLVILGEGELRPALEKQAQNLNLKDRIFLPGRVGNMGEWYEHANLLVMSSRYEGFPMALVEAMAYGLPAVSFDCDTGPRDIIRHEIDGLLVKQDDLPGLQAALARLMTDNTLRKHYANNAKDVLERFSMPRISDMWESLFLEKS